MTIWATFVMSGLGRHSGEVFGGGGFFIVVIKRSWPSFHGGKGPTCYSASPLGQEWVGVVKQRQVSTHLS